MKKILAISEPKTFYHGTASVFIEALLQEIKITGVQNLGFRSQGPGFYTTVQLKAAEHFAFVTAENHSGKPVYCIVEVQNFAQMTGYNRIDHTLVTPEGIIKCSSSVKPSIYVKKVAKEVDYIRAKIPGLEKWEEVVFMERALKNLKITKIVDIPDKL